MKGLASTSLSFATVKVSGRAARKHYGIEVLKPYQHGVHDLQRHFWSAYVGKNMVALMDWFVKKVS